MPGGWLRSYRLGNRTELMAEFVFNTIAFTTRVPRQEDVGHDLICALSELKDKLYWAGPSFTVQVKSDSKPLELAKPHEVTWIKQQENPFFLAVGNRETLTVEIYSTWNRLNGFLAKKADKVIFKLEPPPAGQAHVTTADDGSEQLIHLEKPVVTASVPDLNDEEYATEIRDVLRQWIVLDRENIVNSQAGMHWVVGPTDWETNALFSADTPLMLWIYWNAKNLPKCERNFGRAATALRLTLRKALGKAKEKHSANTHRVEALETALRAYVACIDGPSVGALTEHADMHFEAAI